MYHKLIKQTDKHLIVVTYKLRRRLFITPNQEDIYSDKSLRQNLQGESFGDILQKHGLIPPDMQDLNDRNFQKEYLEGIRDPAAHLIDDEDDYSHFEIAIVNKKNAALVCDCRVRMGEVVFDRFFVVKEGMGTQFVKDGIWFDKVLRKGSPFYS